MIKRLCLALTFPIVCVGCYSQTPSSATKKYLIEHGTMEYKRNDGTSKYYFTDYGNKFREEFFDNSGALTHEEVYNGEVYYSIQGNSIDTLGKINNPYFNSADPQGYKKNRRYKILGEAKTIASQPCQGFEYYNSVVAEMITIYGWNNIVMQQSRDGIVDKEAVKFDPQRPTVSFELK